MMSAILVVGPSAMIARRYENTIVAVFEVKKKNPPFDDLIREASMSFKRPLAVLIVAIVGVGLGSVVPCTAQQLGTYSVPDNKIFVAGISSGGYMAVQMHVAFSGTFKGAAVYAGGPYYCAQDSLESALTPGLADVR